MAFSPQYLEHFTHPRGVGEIDNPNGVSEVAHDGDGCFDKVKMQLRVTDGRIEEVKYLARACSGTIAALSATVEVATGKLISEARALTTDDLIHSLNGIPPKKQHSVDLAIEALRTALDAIN